MPEWFSFGKIRASLARVGMGTKAYATSDGYGIFKQKTFICPTVAVRYWLQPRIWELHTTKILNRKFSSLLNLASMSAF